jgi:hypothetical protein
MARRQASESEGLGPGPSRARKRPQYSLFVPVGTLEPRRDGTYLLVARASEMVSEPLDVRWSESRIGVQKENVSRRSIKKSTKRDVHTGAEAKVLAGINVFGASIERDSTNAG